jgi:hypothetical protein
MPYVRKREVFGVHLGVLELQTETGVHTDVNKL